MKKSGDDHNFCHPSFTTTCLPILFLIPVLLYHEILTNKAWQNMKSQSKFMDHMRKETTTNEGQQKHEQLETKKFKKWN